MSFALAILPFITPGIFAVGAAATSIPIIIHLLNRRRFRTLIWAAMDFLLAAQSAATRAACVSSAGCCCCCVLPYC